MNHITKLLIAVLFLTTICWSENDNSEYGTKVLHFEATALLSTNFPTINKSSETKSETFGSIGGQAVYYTGGSNVWRAGLDWSPSTSGAGEEDKYGVKLALGTGFVLSKNFDESADYYQLYMRQKNPYSNVEAAGEIGKCKRYTIKTFDLGLRYYSLNVDNLNDGWAQYEGEWGDYERNLTFNDLVIYGGLGYYSFLDRFGTIGGWSYNMYGLLGLINRKDEVKHYGNDNVGYTDFKGVWGIEGTVKWEALIIFPLQLTLGVYDTAFYMEFGVNIGINTFL